MLICKLYRIPTVVDSDTPLLPCVPGWKRVIKQFIYPWLFKLPTIFLPSGTRQLKYLQHFGVPKDKIILEKMTIDVTGFQNTIAKLSKNTITQITEKYHISDNHFIFLFVGRLIERKGILLLLEAFSKIKNSSAKLIIAGDGPLKNAVENAASINKNIIYTGRLDKIALIHLYAISKVFVLPALWEPWGLVVNESLAAGKPVIATNQVGCVDDLVIHEETGLVINTNSPSELLEAMQYFINNPKIHKYMSQQALKLISHWCIEDEAKQICLAWDTAIKIKTKKTASMPA